jgi:hypothetical protein
MFCNLRDLLNTNQYKPKTVGRNSKNSMELKSTFLNKIFGCKTKDKLGHMKVHQRDIKILGISPLILFSLLLNQSVPHEEENMRSCYCTPKLQQN